MCVLNILINVNKLHPKISLDELFIVLFDIQLFQYVVHFLQIYQQTIDPMLKL